MPLFVSILALPSAMGCSRPAPTTPPAKEVDEASPTTSRTTTARTFEFDLETTVPLRPDEAFAAFTGDVRPWWDHFFSEGAPAALVIEPFAGGSFYEVLDSDRGSVVHARVIYAEPGKLLRFVGPLGLSGRAVEMAHTFTFEATATGGTRVGFHLEGFGHVDDELVAIVESVWRHFLDRYTAHTKQTTRTSSAAEATLYSQPSATAATSVGLGFFSHADLGAARNHAHADDFVLEHGAVLTRIRWWGLPGPTQANGSIRDASLNNVSGFVVRVHEARDGAGGGVPGAVIFEGNFAMEDTNPTPTGRRGFGKGEASSGLEVRHEIVLTDGPRLVSDRRYFLSVQAFRRDVAGDAWQWQDGVIRNRTSFSRPWKASSWSTIVDTDSAFELLGVERGNDVPTPG